MILFRHADRRFPFLWEGGGQPAGRWNADGDGPVQYFADTPDGAWAEFLRHEGITDPDDLETVVRAMWAVEAPEAAYAQPQLSRKELTGGPESYETCRAEARRLRAAGAQALIAPSAAIEEGGAGGWTVAGGLRPGRARDGRTIAFLGERPDLVGWRTAEGRPGREVLPKVRYLGKGIVDRG